MGMMNVRQQKKLISLSVGAVILGGSLLLAFAAFWPIQVKASPVFSAHSDHVKVISRTQPAETGRKVSLAQLQKISRLKLSQDLFVDPNKKPVIATATSNVSLNITLLGTAIESNRSMAMIQHSDGSVTWRQLGETFKVNGRTVKIIRIETSLMDVEFLGKTQTLKVPKTLAVPTAVSPRAPRRSPRTRRPQ